MTDFGDEPRPGIDRRFGFDELVLPGQQLDQVRDIIARVRLRTQASAKWGLELQKRELGMSALFSGPSGTGKTLTAEVIASELGLDLYPIDLSAIMSKYIGETEKNLSRVFDAAELDGAVLLFDEADALFGRRSEVIDSHDRYFNIGVSYLLSRMGSHPGLTILTANDRDRFDEAFLRRLQFVVDFQHPNRSEREQIWRGVDRP